MMRRHRRHLGPTGRGKRSRWPAALLLAAVLVALWATLALPAVADPAPTVQEAALWNRSATPTVLGSLGGASWAVGINDRGQTVGYWMMPRPGWPDEPWIRTFFWTRAGGMVDVGALGDGTWTEVSDLNTRGQVVGFSADGGTAKPYIWSAGHMTGIDTLGWSRGMANAINNRSQVVGGLGDWEFGGSRAFLWQRGWTTDLGTFTGAGDSWANDINDSGQIVGRATAAGGQTHAFLWTRGVMRDLGTLGGDFSEAYMINQSGQVMGVSTTIPGETSHLKYHAFFWDGGVMTDLGVLGTGDWVIPRDLNDRGEIVGMSQTVSGDFTSARAFHWAGGVLTDLGAAGGTWSQAWAVNNSGRIVGAAADAGGLSHAVRWDGGVLTVLPAAPGAATSSAMDVNSRGQIVGSVIY